MCKYCERRDLGERRLMKVKLSEIIYIGILNFLLGFLDKIVYNLGMVY